MLKLYNTLTRKKEEFRPTKTNRVNIFVCGPTVYDLSHIGHARTYIAFDVIVKYMRSVGYRVFYLQNITDIEDKIINRAKILGAAPLQLAQAEEVDYYQDMGCLGVDGVSKYARATEYIKEIIRQIETLLRKGCAYESGGNVYFDIAKFPEYGKLSHQNLSQLRKAVRIEKDAGKHGDFDFVLWKAKKPGEPFWPSPWGEGRPGWHIEDTAISEKHFGPQYDIHGGSTDLIFPHHESEIAQMEAASGEKPLVRYWLHTGALLVKGKKMSKSLGNYITIRTFLSKYSPEVLRFLVLGTHYRSPIDYSEKLAVQAREGLERINEFIEHVSRIKNSKTSNGGNDTEVKKLIKDTRERFISYMNDDINTPKALSVLFDLVKQGNKLLAMGRVTTSGAKKILAILREFDTVFGILPALRPTKEDKKDTLPENVSKLMAIRERYRREKNWQKADELRNLIKLEGYSIEDTSKGPRLRKLKNRGQGLDSPV